MVLKGTSHRDRVHRMSETDLHLPNLTIRRFRGIQDLSIERLGRMTLIAGKNGVGKTTVLDAVRAYAARGHFSLLSSMLSERDEFVRMVDDDSNEFFGPDWDALCYGWRIKPDIPISIGTMGSPGLVKFDSPRLNEEEARQWTRRIPEIAPGEELRYLRFTYAGKVQSTLFFSSRRQVFQTTMMEEFERAPSIQCESLGPSLLDNAVIGRLWDRVALSDDEDSVVEALRLVFGEMVRRAAVIGDERKASYGRRVVVRMAGQERPVPLRSLGDGAVRLFGVALALANSQGGFLLIDEAENGIHYSLQRDFWRMVLLTAQANNVQVFATTHSWDCAAGFAQAAVDAEDVEGALVRLERDGDTMRAVEYSERQLQVAAEQGIEVR